MNVRRQLLLPLTLGVADGIVNALTLASATVLHGRDLDVTLALRVGVVALVTAVFTVYVAEYAELRAQLARAARQLNMSASGRSATTNLGRQVIRDATRAAMIASGASFAGASLPLLAGTFLRGWSWLALVVSIIALGALGGGLARVVGGSLFRWTASLVLMGLLVAVIGTELDFV